MTASAGNENGRPVDQSRPDDDWELIRQVGAGDEDALEKLYKQFYGGLYRFVLNITRNVDSVEEVINEVMFVVWEKAALVEPRSKASTWIFGIAHKKALQIMRRSRAPGSVSFEEEGTLDLVYEESVPLRELESEELLGTLLRSLTPEQRAVMELVYYQGLHYAEVAQVVDCPENTVKTRVFHARKKLRALWPGLTGNTALQLSRIKDR